MLQRGHSADGCDLASTLCKYDLRKGNLFDLSSARVRRVRRGSFSLVHRRLHVDSIVDSMWWRCAQYFVIASCG